MKRILFDIETNGLLDELDTIHSLVLIDMDTEEEVSCADIQSDQKFVHRFFQGPRTYFRSQRASGTSG